VTPPIDKAALERETASAIFNRINRRREETVQPLAGSVFTATGRPTGLSDPPPPDVNVTRGLFEAPPVAASTVADRFPRSATMRLVLKHPAVALGLGLPAAGLLLKSSASRRLLGMALRVGVGEEIQSLVRLTNAAVPSTVKDRPATDPNPPEK
jgi:hypothetical protein